MGCSMRESTPPREGAMYGKRTESTNLAVPHKSEATCTDSANPLLATVRLSLMLLQTPGGSRQTTLTQQCRCHSCFCLTQTERRIGRSGGACLKADYAAKAAEHLGLCNGVVGVGGKPRVVHPRYSGVLLQALRNLHGGLQPQRGTLKQIMPGLLITPRGNVLSA